jgi:uncharacterized protein YdcH (DUF465 family)
MRGQTVSEMSQANAKTAEALAKTDAEIATLLAEHRELTQRIARLETAAQSLARKWLQLEPQT